MRRENRSEDSITIPNSEICETLLIGGQIAAGKSETALAIANATDAKLLRVRVALSEVASIPVTDRRRLQVEGTELDKRTNGRWLLDYLDERFSGGMRCVVDSARTRRQVEPILESRPSTRLVYLNALESTRRHRFSLGAHGDPVKRSMPFDEAMRFSTESEAKTIREMAHLVIDTDDLDVEQISSLVIEWCGWRDLI